MTLRVWVNDRPVGRLARHGRGTTFAYDRGVSPADAVGLAMPVRTASYDSPHGLLPVFDTNLPEGFLREVIQKALAKAQGRADALDVLRVVGCNQIGRLRVLPEDGTPGRQAPIGRIDEILERRATRAFINEVTERHALRSGVSGAMPKVLVETLATDTDVGAHRRTIPLSDHILKFDAEDYPGLSLNEFYCLEAARAGGNVTAEARLNVDGRMLSVRRFDGPDGHRLGFEDLASLNARPAEDKYAGSVETDLFRRVAEFSGADRRPNHEALFRLCVTNIALRNGDAHLKNFAMLFPDAETGPFTLAPAYDLVNTTTWIRADMMALNLGGSKRWPRPDATLRMGARAGLPRHRAQAIIGEVADGIRSVMPAMLDAFESHGLPDIGHGIAAAWNAGLTSSLGMRPASLPEPSATGSAHAVKVGG